MKKILLNFLVAPALLLAASSNGVPEQVENLAWDPQKAPVMEETPPSDKYSKKEWQRVTQAKAPKCKKGETLWKVGQTSLIEATATKETSLGVKGKFSRFSALAHEKAGKLLGAGSLDLSSWDSGVAPRDYRVIKYVFATQEAGHSVLPFKFRVENWAPQQGTWVSPVALQFRFQKTPVELTFPAHIKTEGKVIRVTSAESKRFTFLSPKNLGAFQKLMELCNHHFLASFADISFDFILEDACPH